MPDERAALEAGFSYFASGRDELARLWKDAEAAVESSGTRPSWSAYQTAAARELDAVLSFCEKYLAVGAPTSLAMVRDALLRLAASDEADSVLLTSRSREESQRGEKYETTASLKAAAGVVMQLLMETGKGRAEAAKVVATAISRAGFAVTDRTVANWRDAGNACKSPFGDEYHRQLARSRDVHFWPDNPFGPAPEILPLQKILANVAGAFGALPKGFGGKKRQP